MQGTCVQCGATDRILDFEYLVCLQCHPNPKPQVIPQARPQPQSKPAVIEPKDSPTVKESTSAASSTRAQSKPLAQLNVNAPNTTAPNTTAPNTTAPNTTAPIFHDAENEDYEKSTGHFKELWLENYQRSVRFNDKLLAELYQKHISDKDHFTTLGDYLGAREDLAEEFKAKKRGPAGAECLHKFAHEHAEDEKQWGKIIQTMDEQEKAKQKLVEQYQEQVVLFEAEAQKANNYLELMEADKAKHNSDMEALAVKHNDTVKNMKEDWDKKSQEQQKQIEGQIAVMKQLHEVQLQAMKDQKALLEKQAEEAKKQAEAAQREAANARNSHNHSYCCFPASATVVLESGVLCKVSELKAQQCVKSIDDAGRVCYSEVFFVDGEAGMTPMRHLFYRDETGEEMCMKLTHEHLIWIYKHAEADCTAIAATEPVTAGTVVAGEFLLVLNSQGVLVPRRIERVSVALEPGRYQVLTKHHRLLVENVLVSAYEINQTWGAVDTILMRILYVFSPDFVNSEPFKKYCKEYDLIFEPIAKKARALYHDCVSSWF